MLKIVTTIWVWPSLRKTCKQELGFFLICMCVYLKPHYPSPRSFESEVIRLEKKSIIMTAMWRMDYKTESTRKKRQRKSWDYGWGSGSPVDKFRK